MVQICPTLRLARVLILVTLVITAPLARSADFCVTPPKSPQADKLKSQAEQLVADFSRKKIVTDQADAMLSKLLAAKSPVIMGWLQKRGLIGKPEEQIIREWRQYYAHTIILTRYPQNDPTLNREIEALANQIIRLSSSREFVQKMEVLFQKAKTGANAAIQNMPIPSDAKQAIKKRLQSVKLYWIKDFKTARNNQVPLDILEWGIAYDPAANEINMGFQAANYPNEETYTAVFAHELGHSFDSCRWGAYFQGPWPFEKIGECLRGAGSVGAKRRDDSQMEPLVKNGVLAPELAQALKANPTCNKMAYPPAGIQADQLPESFADWFSAEVTARVYLDRPTNLRSDLCEERKLIEGSSYPANRDRLTRIYFAQPRLKGHAGNLSTPEASYCSMGK